MKERIIQYIKHEICNEPLEGIDVQDDLLGSGIVDSMGMMKLVLFLENEFKVQISTEDMTVENFMTVKNIMEYLSKK